MKRGETLQIEAIERRLAALTNSPYENGEGLQLTRYEEGQFYLPHHDYFDPTKPGFDKYLAQGGQRVFSVILYLNDGFRAGETEFPVLRFLIPPTKGSALVLANMDLQTDVLDDSTLHGGRAPVGGTKFIATKWIRQNAF
jgi:prolyl 4-hydroxylase